MADEDEQPSFPINSEQLLIECGGRRFIVSPVNAARIVMMARNNAGWAHIGPYIVHLAGAVVGPFTDEDLPEKLKVVIDDELHEQFRVSYEDMFSS